MDCRTALEILEVARPESADRDEPEVAAASAHVETCPECEDRFVARQRFDRNLGRLMRDVAVPDHLQSRILASLAAAQSAAREAAPSDAHWEAAPPEIDGRPVSLAERPERRTWAERRAHLLLMASMSLGLLVAVITLVVYTTSTAEWTLAKLRHEAPVAYQQFDQLPRFEGSFKPELPTEFGWQTSRSIHISRPPHGFPPGAGPHLAAVYFFTVDSPRGRPVQGILLVTPKDRVADPPETSHFDAQGVGSGPFGTVAWTERDLVYVCVVEGGGDSLERLQQALRLSRAA